LEHGAGEGLAVSLSAVVMAHPKRAHFVDQLLETVGDIPVIWDEREDRWDTGRRALLAFDPAASHHLVIQDDAIPCRDLPAGALAAGRAAGERPVCLYVGRGRPHRHTVARAVKRVRAQGSPPWLAMEGPWWGVGIVLPTSQIPELVRWGDANAFPNYDRRITRWYGQAGIDCWYTLPSLVDHRPVDENPSLIAGRTGNRRAHWFIGTEASALDVDWEAGPPVEPEPVLEFRHRGTGRRVTAARGTPLYQRLERSALWDAIVPGQPPPWLKRRERKETSTP
jgi:hypothetical protein